MLNEADRCKLCGTTSDEWEDNAKAYAPTESFCKGCYLKEIAGEDTESLPGTTITLIPTTSLAYKANLLRMKKDWETKQGDE